jgi:hypothetical protein
MNDAYATVVNFVAVQSNREPLKAKAKIDDSQQVLNQSVEINNFNKFPKPPKWPQKLLRRATDVYNLQQFPTSFQTTSSCPTDVFLSFCGHVETSSAKWIASV